MIVENPMHRCTVAALVLGSAVWMAVPALAQAPKIGDPPQAKNMRLVGFNDLQARSTTPALAVCSNL